MTDFGLTRAQKVLLMREAQRRRTGVAGPFALKLTYAQFLIAANRTGNVWVTR